MGLHPQTLLVRQQAERSTHREHSVPLYMTSSFTFETAEQMRQVFAEEEEGWIYSRYDNPNNQELIDKICLLEHAASGLATASGMAAVFASTAGLLKQGDHIIASRSVFGSTHQLLTKILPSFGISGTYVDGTDPMQWNSAVQPNTKMLLLETPSNPGLQIIDIQQCAAFAKQHGLILNIDNCFATPAITRPIDLGAHIVTHSATKYIDGQGRTLGGLIVGDAALIEQMRYFVRHTGPALSPFNAWVLSKSLDTLFIRVKQHAANALFVAKALEDHDDIELLKYPHLPSHPQYETAIRQMDYGGGILTIELKGGSEKAVKFMNNLQLFSISANLGDARSIVTHPATSTHARLTPEERHSVGISDSLIRLSIGLEHSGDIVNDILMALRLSRY